MTRIHSGRVYRWPEHLRDRPGLRRKLRSLGNGLRGLYGTPVFLVGSALIDSNRFPRDWDIRIGLSNSAFRRRYGDPEQWSNEGHTGLWTAVRWRWSDDCVKQSQDSFARSGLNCDVQVSPESLMKAFYYRPRLRIDTR